MKLTSDEIFFINTLYKIAAVHAKDCLITDDVISFLVKKEDVGKAIGKNASNIKELCKKTKKRIEILEYSTSPVNFLKKALYKIKPKDISEAVEDGRKKIFVSLDSENRKKMLGSLGRLKRIKEIAKRNYKVDDIRIR